MNYSIIIPHKNTPHLLQRCIDSIPLRKDLEIIIIDDNSDSKKVDFNSFPGISRKDTRIFFTKEGKGAGFARNFGLKYAKGKWILFADADDFFIENFIEKLDIYKDKDANLVLFKTQCKMSNDITKDGKRQWLCNKWNILIDEYYKNKNIFHDLLSSVVVPWGKMIKKKFLIKNNISFEEIQYANDVIWSTKICINIYQKDFIASQHVIYCLTENVNSLFNNSSKKGFLIRFDTLLRQQQLLTQANINVEKVNYNYYLGLAQKLGIITLIKSIFILKKNTNYINPVYKIEEVLNFNYPYIYFIIIILQSIYHIVKTR